MRKSAQTVAMVGIRERARRMDEVPCVAWAGGRMVVLTLAARVSKAKGFYKTGGRPGLYTCGGSLAKAR